MNLDYPHGTGHGVGYFLNVHEGPIAFSKNKVNLSEGMIIQMSLAITKMENLE